MHQGEQNSSIEVCRVRPPSSVESLTPRSRTAVPFKNGRSSADETRRITPGSAVNRSSVRDRVCV
ncbi:hypothetical protein DSECCO2_502610 [anaerobic digester metagenome]